MKVKDINKINYYLTKYLQQLPSTEGMKENVKLDIEKEKDEIVYLMNSLLEIQITK